MRRFLHFTIVFCVFMVSFFLCSCVKNEDSGPSGEAPKSFSEMSLEDILSAIYGKGGYSKELEALISAPVPDMDKGEWNNHLVITNITEENAMSYFGTADVEAEYAIASEAAMNPTTYLLCLAKIKDGADVKKNAELIRENANPMRWVCTGLSKDHVYVDYFGDVVILVMSAGDGEALISAFRDITAGVS